MARVFYHNYGLATVLLAAATLFGSVFDYGHGVLHNVRKSAWDFFDAVKVYARDLFTSFASPVLTLRKLSASLFGPDGALAIYDRRRSWRISEEYI